MTHVMAALARDETARPKRSTRHAQEKHRVLKSMARSLNDRSLPPMDERLKSIVVSQIGTLLRGGYAVEMIERIAIATALSWDEARGHSRLTHLSQRIRLLDVAEQRAEHERRKADEREQMDPKVAAMIAPTRPPRPTSHAFQRSDRPNTCGVCEGPLGVHVRIVRIDDEGNGVVVPTGIAP